jgi:restriction endonuclease Mrr
MPFPTFEQVLKELLVFTRESTKKSSSYNTERAIRNLATHFNLSEEEKEIEYEGGKLFRSLVTHARNHLKGAGLLEGTSKSFDITSEGRLLIRKKTAVIDEKVLAQYDEYKLFLKEVANDSKINAQWYKDNGVLTPNKMFAALKKAISDSNSANSINESDLLEAKMRANKIKLLLQNRSIEREMDKLHHEHISNIKEKLLEKVKQISPALFEKLCVELITKLVYEGNKPPANLIGQIKTVGKSGDGGIDGIITKKDKIHGERKY